MRERVLACLVAAALAVSFVPLAAWGDEPSTDGDETFEATPEALDEESIPEASSSIKVDLSDSIAVNPSASLEGEDEALGALSVADGPMKEVHKGVVTDNFDVISVDGPVTKLNSDYPDSVRVVIFGRSSCSNTTATAERLKNLLSKDAYSKVKGFVLCADERDSAAFTQKYKGVGAQRMIYAADAAKGNYNSYMWDMCAKVGFSLSSVTLPLTIIVDGNNAVRYASLGALPENALASYLDVTLGTKAPDDVFETVDFKVSGTDNAKSARSVLAMVNAERSKKGVGALTWDEDLEKAAQQRAAEVAILFSHDRPDDSSCFTAIPPAKKGQTGENIYIGSSNAATAHEKWTNSFGHYSNMVNGYFSSMGVASFVCSTPEGYSYAGWVELFSSAQGTGMVSQAKDNVSVTRSIHATASNLNLELSGADALEAGKSDAFILYNVNKEWEYATQAVEPSSAVWSSSNASVASVDKAGKIVAKQTGSATVKAAMGSLSASKSVKVTAAPVVPDKPTNPDTPTTPDKPSNPDKPTTPDKPSKPAAAQAPRLAGDTALDTMASITKKGFAAGSCDTVVVATMGGYWDALSASALAGLEGCPVLLTDGTSLSAQTASEVKRLGASKVYVAGGAAAVSAKAVSALKALPGVRSVERLAGDTAVETALKIYEEGKGKWGKTAVVATSYTFQDALSASPYAYAKKAPVFLANASTGLLDPAVLDAVKKGGFERVVVVGGTAAISGQVEKSQLKGIPCKRLAGPTAYETSGAIAEWCLAQGMTAANVGVATGASYYDALAGAALCGKNNSALVLVADGWTSNVDGFLKKHKASVREAYVFGGPAAVSASTYKAIGAALK